MSNQIRQLMLQAMSDGTVSRREADDFIRQAGQQGWSSTDIAAAAQGIPGLEPFTNADTVYDFGFDNYNGLRLDGSIFATPNSVPGPGGGTVVNNNYGGASDGDSFITGSATGGGGAPTASPAEWAQIAQTNADWLNGVQSSIFNNPNIFMPDGSSQTVNFGEMPNFREYVANNPDILRDFQSANNPIKDITAYGKYHWENHGQFEGRQLPLASPAELGLLQPEVNIELSPQEQAIFDANQRSRSARAALGESQINRVADSFGGETIFDSGNLFDPSQFMTDEGIYEFSMDPTIGGLDSVRDALMERNQPFFDRRRQQTENDLLTRGLNPGTEAWDARMDDLNRAENDFLLGATERAGMEMERLQTMQGQRRQQDVAERNNAYQVGRDWRSNQIEEDAYRRNMPLNEMNALESGTQINRPGFTGYSGYNFTAPDFAGAEQETWNRDFAQQQRKDQRNAGLWSAVGSIAGAGLQGFGQGGGWNSIFGGP